MCNGPLNGIVDSFSALQLLRNYNRLVAPTDFNQYYNLSFIKDFQRTNVGAAAPFTLSKPIDFLPATVNPLVNPLQNHPFTQFQQSNETNLITSRSSPNRTTVTSTCPPTPPTAIAPRLPGDPFSNFCENPTTACDRFGENVDAANRFGNFNPMPTSAANTSSSNDATTAGTSDLSSIEHFQCILSRRQRGEKRPIPDEQKDEKYFERRKRNNEAAKKSRDARKLREDRIAIRAALLEQENAILRAQILALREELATLQQLMCSRANR